MSFSNDILLSTFNAVHIEKFIALNSDHSAQNITTQEEIALKGKIITTLNTEDLLIIKQKKKINAIQKFKNI